VFQTMISDLTGLEVANASLLDEATAAAESMLLSFLHSREKKKLFYVEENSHSHAVAVMKTRAMARDMEVVVCSVDEMDFSKNPCGVYLQYPNNNGQIIDFTDTIKKAKE